MSRSSPAHPAAMALGRRAPGNSGLAPPLKWAGGKRWLVPRLAGLWDEHRERRLVEPFCGGLAVALGLEPRRALLSDANPHAINFYRQIQRGLQIDIELPNQREAYYLYRERFNHLITENRYRSAEAAALFYYLNRTGFNGLCRFNRSGLFNVPFGRFAKIGYRRDFHPYRELLSRWEFGHGDFAELQLEGDDFVYADPPYDVQFTQYSRAPFGWDAQLRLADWLAAHPGPVVASNQATPRILELYRAHGFEVTTLPAPRHISRTGDRTPACEMLASRNL